jgi:hypothetical protein
VIRNDNAYNPETVIRRTSADLCMDKREKRLLAYLNSPEYRQMLRVHDPAYMMLVDAGDPEFGKIQDRPKFGMAPREVEANIKRKVFPPRPPVVEVKRRKKIAAPQQKPRQFPDGVSEFLTPAATVCTDRPVDVPEGVSGFPSRSPTLRSSTCLDPTVPQVRPATRWCPRVPAG